MRAKFAVTFEIVTPESAEHGDAESRGFVGEALTLREALRELGCGHIEADSYPLTRSTAPRWFTRYGETDYRTGADESRALHIPESITPASRLRLARLIGCHGAKR